MPRYIDAEAFESSARERYCTDCDNSNGVKCRACWVDDMLGEVEDAPTVSPDEVRGVGKWIERDDYDWDIYYECSVCHTPFTMLDGTTPELNDYHYCPNCGAKMEVSEDA